MEFRKMVMITLYARLQKRHRCIEQSFGLCGRGRGWDDLGEWHWRMYIIICDMNCQSRFDAGYKMLGAGALGWPRGMVRGGRWEGGSGWGTRVHTHGIFMLIYGKTNTILQSKKKYIWISSNEVGETGAYYTEWGKPERKTPIQHTNSYIWNLERW